MNVNKCTKAGGTFIFWVADWFALMNDKMGTARRERDRDSDSGSDRERKKEERGGAGRERVRERKATFWVADWFALATTRWVRCVNACTHARTRRRG